LGLAGTRALGAEMSRRAEPSQQNQNALSEEPFKVEIRGFNRE